MNSGLKNTLIVLFAIIAGGITIYLCEFIIEYLTKQPMTDHTLIKDYPKYLVLILMAHGIGSIVTGWILGKLIRHHDNFLVLLAGLFWTIIGVANIVSVEHPVWFAISDTCIYLPMSVLGKKLADLNK